MVSLKHERVKIYLLFQTSFRNFQKGNISFLKLCDQLIQYYDLKKKKRYSLLFNYYTSDLRRSFFTKDFYSWPKGDSDLMDVEAVLNKK